MKALTKETQAKISPAGALQLLKEGNKRFVSDKKASRDLLEQVRDTATGQYPFATILSCIDSRVSAELIFDQGVGDIFSVRVAGNIVNEDLLGSMEFACKLAGTRVILVLGHTSCGAVKGACDGVKLGNLTGLLAKIQPAIDSVPDDGKPRTSKNKVFTSLVSHANVRVQMGRIRKESPVLRELEEQGKIDIVGAVYDVETAKVAWHEK